MAVSVWMDWYKERVMFVPEQVWSPTGGGEVHL